MLMMILLFFILGLILGSFYNVCIYRIPVDQSVVFGRSHCGNCDHVLGPLDMIPVLSYVMLRGKCRYCGVAFSPRYALVELLTGLLFALTFHLTGLELELIPRLVMVSLLIIITFIDIDHMIIPFRLTITGGVLALIWQITAGTQSWISVALGFVLGFGLLAIFVFFGGMGGGDAFLGGMFGLYFGLTQTFALLMISFIIGGLFSIYVLLTGRRKRHEKLPFGPFLALAGLIMLFWGPQILNWYGF